MLYVQIMVSRKKRTIWYVPLVKRLRKNNNKQSMLIRCVSRWNVYIYIYIFAKIIHGPSNVKLTLDVRSQVTHTHIFPTEMSPKYSAPRTVRHGRYL